tara:strand:+ start:433 stop:612 length:180 start_codon:yes stop_codon:yes gene_type:complete
VHVERLARKREAERDARLRKAERILDLQSKVNQPFLKKGQWEVSAGTASSIIFSALLSG